MLSIILKGTNGCNLACSYCSLGKKNYIQIADEVKLVDIFRYACKVCEFRKENRLLFILHGGEPTLIKTNVYANAIDKVRKEYPNIKMEFSMQTNGLSINDDLIQFIKKYDIHIGVSIDGSKSIHDSERKSVTNKGTFEKVSGNIIKMLNNEINVSCLMVLTSNAFKEGYDYLSFFEKWNLHLKVNPLLNYGEVYEHPELSLKRGQYAKYLIEMYKYIIKKDINISVSPLDKILQGVLSDGKVHECSFNAKCNQNFLCIDYNGNIYPCGKYSDMGIYKIGNIKDGNLDVMSSPIMIELINRRTNKLPIKCNKCKFIKMCNAGCNAEASIDGNINDQPLLCHDYKELFAFFHGEGLIILKEELLRQKQQEVINNGV
ncbi:hypothetical protein Z969_10040 [Clostridium novyi A str. 4570]|uniref:Radical SAM core domain-containing protein n=1 Tax=Clostridium novyi A str. 4570 TaxID=1444290 RepID=A0AA88ZPW9_CLONO|nr:radical SAM protein [Clostridium novyi]KGN00180.1 hypothetical protein Z969_10040 [Clostridium novyi A str. 4570]